MIRQTVAHFLLDPTPFFTYIPVIMDNTFSLLVFFCLDNSTHPQFLSIYIPTYQGLTTSCSRDSVTDWFLFLFFFGPPHRFVFPRYSVTIVLHPSYFPPLLFPFIFEYFIPKVVRHAF